MPAINANAEYRNNSQLYLPRTERAFDTRAASSEYENAAPDTQPFETTAAQGGFGYEMYEAPYELHLPNDFEMPQLKLYKPEPRQYHAGDFQPVGYSPDEPPEKLELPGEKRAEGDGAKTMEEINEETKCPVCENRKYQDGSDDPGVSLKFATKLNPYSATAAVRAHEYQHVRHHQMEADKNGRKIISQTVMLKTRRCPHCGKTYTAGGVTKTVTAAYSDCAHMSARSQEGQSLDKCV